MRAITPARGLVVATLALGAGVIVAALFFRADPPLGVLALLGVVVVDRLRGAAWRYIAFNASVFALAAAGGGFAFELVGGTPGSLDLPADFGAVGVLAAVAFCVNTLLVSAVVALDTKI